MNGTGVMTGFNTSFVDPKDALALHKMDSIHSAKKSNRRTVSLGIKLGSLIYLLTILICL